MPVKITLSRDAKATIKELWQQRPDLSARDIADLFSLSHNEVHAYLTSIGYTTEKRKAALRLRKQSMGFKKEEPTLVKPTFERGEQWRMQKTPLYAEKKMEEKLKKKVDETEALMMKASSEGDLEAFIASRKNYDAAQRRLLAYRMQGTMKEADKEISKLEQQYQKIN